MVWGDEVEDRSSIEDRLSDHSKRVRFEVEECKGLI